MADEPQGKPDVEQTPPKDGDDQMTPEQLQAAMESAQPDPGPAEAADPVPTNGDGAATPEANAAEPQAEPTDAAGAADAPAAESDTDAADSLMSAGDLESAILAAAETAIADTGDEPPVNGNGHSTPAGSNGAHLIGRAGPDPLSAAQAFSPPDLSGMASKAAPAGLDLLDDVDLDVKIELGRTNMYIEDVLNLGAGSVVELDKLAGDPVDIYVNEKLVARGEVLVLNDNFCVRVNDIVSSIPELEGEG